MKRGGRESYPSTRTAGFHRLLLEVRAAVEAGVKVHFRYIAWLISDIIATPAWLVLFVTPVLLFLPREQWSNPVTLNFFFWGYILWDFVAAGLWSFGMAIRREQQLGTLEFLMVTNANRAILFSRSVYPRMISLSIGILYVYAFFKALFGVDVVLRSPLGVVAVLLTGMLTALGFGLVYGALVFRFKNVGPLNNVLQFVFLGLCGIFYPVSNLPEPLRSIALAVPFTYVADLLRFYAMEYPAVLPSALEWAVLLTYTLGLIALGVALLKAVEGNLKKTGGLGAY
ncbi:MAG: ABC transporter permease [Thermofilum sp.]